MFREIEKITAMTNNLKMDCFIRVPFKGKEASAVKFFAIGLSPKFLAFSFLLLFVRQRDQQVIQNQWVICFGTAKIPLRRSRL